MVTRKSNPFRLTFNNGIYTDGKLVGGYIPQPSADRLRLLALYKNESVQSILQEIIDEWIKQQAPYVTIIEILVDKIHAEWIRRGRDFKNWQSYKNEIEERLKKRKINNQDIYNILKEMRIRIGKN